jgi:hypothetical protein
MHTADELHNQLIITTNNPRGILDVHYNKGNSPGNFSIPLINYYLLKQQQPAHPGYMTPLLLPTYSPTYPRSSPENYPRGIHLGSTKEQIMQLLQNHTAILLHYTTRNTRGHAVCLKKHENTWYLLDSEVGSPINLDTTPGKQEWQLLCGHTYTMTPTLPRDQGLFDPTGPQWTNTPTTITLTSPVKRTLQTQEKKPSPPTQAQNKRQNPLAPKDSKDSKTQKTREGPMDAFITRTKTINHPSAPQEMEQDITIAPPPNPAKNPTMKRYTQTRLKQTNTP